MLKTKYHYDPKTLSYREIKNSKSVQLRNLLAFLSASMFFGIISLLILLNFSIINTPTELFQAREISNYKFQFDLLEKEVIAIMKANLKKTSFLNWRKRVRGRKTKIQNLSERFKSKNQKS